MLVIGHRGAAGHVAENTVGSMRKAIALGVDGLEFDVCALADRLIVLHDEHVDRTTDGSGPYNGFTLDELRALSTANGEAIPFLEEILDVSGGGLLVNVEVKQAGIAARVLAALESYLAEHPAWISTLLLSSFDPSTAEELAAQRGRHRFGLLYEGPFDAALTRAVALMAWSIHLPFDDVSTQTVAAAHDAGLSVLVYTVNDPARIAHCAACAVDGVFSDFPDRVIDYNRGHPRPAGESP